MTRKMNTRLTWLGLACGVTAVLLTILFHGHRHPIVFAAVCLCAFGFFVFFWVYGLVARYGLGSVVPGPYPVGKRVDDLQRMEAIRRLNEHGRALGIWVEADEKPLKKEER